ncbi:MAG: hypothetical protein ACP5VR_05095 [Acidimicrobiales bacterium]
MPDEEVAPVLPGSQPGAGRGGHDFPTGAVGGAPSGSGAASGDAPFALSEWPALLTGRVVGAVEWLKRHATLRLTTVLGVVMYGLVALVGLLSALVLGLMAVVRIWDVYLPVNPEGRRVWLAYVVLGALFCLTGAWLWSKTGRKSER